MPIGNQVFRNVSTALQVLELHRITDRINKLVSS